MSRFRTTVCRVALAIAAILGGDSAWGGEVTVVGSLWQPRPVFVPNDAPPMPPSPDAPMPPSPDAPMQAGAVPTNGSPDAALDFDDWFANRPFWDWNIDYRCRALAGSSTSCEFGTNPSDPLHTTPYAPFDRMNFPINSLWHGVRAGINQPTWGVQFEWMMPQQGIGGQFSDHVWDPPNPDGSYTDLGFADQRWIDGQMIDFGMEFQWTDHIFNLPIEIWPIAGFRWQRFNIRCVDRVQYKYGNQWFNPPDEYPGEVLRFNQQYYMGYLGGQFRARLRTVLLTFQADWGCTWGNNVAHDLLADGDQYTMDFTQGNSWHVGFTAEVPLSLQVSLGFQFDRMQIATTGTHHLLNLPLGEDSSWNNGVSVSSNQTSVMAFLRLRM